MQIITIVCFFQRFSGVHVRHLFKIATPYLFFAPAGLVMAVGLIYPIGYLFYAGFLDWNPSVRIEEADWVWLKNYWYLLQDESFHESFWVTLTFASSVVALELIAGVSLALLMNRSVPFLSVLRTLFLLPFIIAPIVVGLMWRYMYHPSVGIFNMTLTTLGFEPIPWLSDSSWSLVSVIIADIWQWTPFVFILTLAALQALPKSVLEASRLDGANTWQRVVYVQLPMIMPTLVVTAMLRLIDAFKVLEVILVMTNGGPGLSTEILALRISRTASEFRQLGTAAAMSNVLLFLLLLVTLAMVVHRKLTKIHEKK